MILKIRFPIYQLPTIQFYGHWVTISIYSKSLSYTVLRTAVLSSTDFSKVPKSFVLHENLEQCEFLYIWIWVTRIFVLSNTILRVILSWIQMFWAARFLSYTDFPLSQKSCSSRSYCIWYPLGKFICLFKYFYISTFYLLRYLQMWLQ